ncbi:hypothetical protein M2T78_07435 [Elizabethkingia ursingii]|uniref:hypothetical protein n=1 Tax=Elizabethkingia ursingii TaxID=1756150 RepID=UPI002010CBA2|nr:hypothetical protein [Elizabethkingia ursingii]MCL1664080.1 hypothetical protein [Elizabethkingia ursingii]
MNYLDLLHKFWDYNQKEPLGVTTIAMYLFLLEMWYVNEENDFKVSDIVICEKLLLTRPTVKVNKEKLRNCGLIYYETQNGLPSYYRIILDYTSLRKGEKPKKDVAERNQKSGEPLEKTKSIPSMLKEVPSEEIEEPMVVNPSSQEPVKPNIITDNKAIPTITEIIDYATTLPNYDPSLDTRIQDRYESWVNNGWRTMQDKPIKEWKPLLKSTVNYFVNPPKNGTLTLDSIPNIKVPKPKSTYNE